MHMHAVSKNSPLKLSLFFFVLLFHSLKNHFISVIPIIQ